MAGSIETRDSYVSSSCLHFQSSNESSLIMGIASCEMEVPVTISAAKMFQAFTVDANYLYPKVAPHTFHSVEILQGDGGVGTINKLNFGQSIDFKYVKQQIDRIDEDKLLFGYSVIEGEALLMDKIEKISNEIELVASGDEGCICKCRIKYYTIGDAEMKEEEVTVGKQRVAGFLKAMEAYLLDA